LVVAVYLLIVIFVAHRGLRGRAPAQPCAARARPRLHLKGRVHCFSMHVVMTVVMFSPKS